MGEASEHPPEEAAPLAEEALAGTEDGGYEVSGDAAFVEFLEIVAPEFIFDEDGHRGADKVKEFADAAGGVEGEVDDGVDVGVVFSDFESGRGEKAQEDGDFGMFAAEAFDHGASLLEFAQG